MAGPSNEGAANPRRDAGRGDPTKCDCLAAVGSTNTPTTGDLQHLRALWLARRCLLAPALVGAVASLAFSVTEER